MRGQSIVRAVLGMCVLLWCIAPAVGGAVGEEAPVFDLPLLTGDGYRGSADLFGTYLYIFLVFWESHCPHCVEALGEC